MRLVLMSTATDVDGAWIEEIVDQIGAEEPEVTVVLLRRPGKRLPVHRCLAVERRLRPGRRVEDVPVQGAGRRPKPAPQARAVAALDDALMRWAPTSWRSNKVLFASGVVASRPVRAAFAEADLVLATDWNAVWGTWLLAQQLRRPAVTFGVQGAIRSLAG